MKKILLLLLLFCLNASSQTNTYNTLDKSAQATFSTLPTASKYTGQQFYVSDIGTNGSLWVSNGAVWSPVGGIVNVLQVNYPFILPPTGSLAVTTGVLTLGTALDQTYPNAFMYFPANTWTSSTAGWYYVTCSSTTSCLVYSNSYTSGIPVTPAGPTLVTTGAGTYTQTTATYLTGLSLTVPANIMGLNSTLLASFFTSNNNSATAKFNKVIFGGQSLTSVNKSTITASNIRNFIINQNATNIQSTISESLSSGVNAFLTVDTTVSQSIAIALYLSVATDYVVLQGFNIQLYK